MGWWVEFVSYLSMTYRYTLFKSARKYLSIFCKQSFVQMQYAYIISQQKEFISHTQLYDMPMEWVAWILKLSDAHLGTAAIKSDMEFISWYGNIVS